VLVKSLETMDLRLRAQEANAVQVANWLEARPEVSLVCYPGLASHPQADLARRQMSGGGTVVTFTVDTDKAGAYRVLDALAIIDISNNLGDTKSLITHPSTTTHSRFSEPERCEMGILDGTMRLSVGLEDPLDLIDDLEAAFAKL